MIWDVVFIKVGVEVMGKYVTLTTMRDTPKERMRAEMLRDDLEMCGVKCRVVEKGVSRSGMKMCGVDVWSRDLKKAKEAVG